MTTFQVSIIIVASLHIGFECLMNFLNLRNLRTLKNNQPDDSKNLMDQEKWCETTDYSVAKTKFSFIENLYGLILFVILILYFFPAICNAWDLSAENGVLSCAFLSICFLLIIQVPYLPLEWYKQFRIEENFGFNKSSIGLWISDKLKGNILGLLLGTLILGMIIWLYRVLSQMSNYWWIFVFLAFFAVQLLLMVLWPKFILPLFNKLTPLEDGVLKTRLMNLADRSGFAANTIEVIDGSKRSSHSNAYFTGFGKFRRIVLFDTLIDKMDDQEIEAVLAHEIGHYKLGHIPKRLFLSFLTGLLAFYGLSLALSQAWVMEGLQLHSGLTGSLAPLLIALILILPNFTYWLSPLSNIFSRKHEYEADRFAKNAMNDGIPLQQALAKLYRENLSHPMPHALLVFFHYSHPTYFDRVKALQN